MASLLKPTGDKVLDEMLLIMITRFENLVKKGFLAPSFLDKMREDPNEILQFLRQNRSVVGDQLSRRLDPRIRPSPHDLEKKGIVPFGYFSHGHKQAIAKKHRRRSTAGQDLAMMIKLRPNRQQIVDKGIVKPTQKSLIEDPLNYDRDDLDNLDQESNEIYKISILSTLLFKTIAEALRNACFETSKQEESVLNEMAVMNEEMRQLRNTLDKYFLSPNPDILSFQKEEDSVRNKFHSIQQKLFSISTRQNQISEKLQILHSVERSMIDLQNDYDQRLGELKQREERLLHELQSQKLSKDKALKIMLSEQSKQDWATAKLTFTIEMAQKSKTSDEDQTFIDELNDFLNNLKKISINQRQIVKDYEDVIGECEQRLIRIRHDMAKVRTMTFKKIYDLHKQVQIAEALELGINRRLSVASATELENEKRHFRIKIQRQLATLNNEKILNGDRQSIEKYEQKLDEIVDVERVMSDEKLKIFFAVFVQICNQTLIDIELMHQNVQSRNVLKNGVTTKEHLDKISDLCHKLYGIANVINKIKKEDLLRDKLKKCMRFIAVLKRAIAKEYKVEKIASHRMNLIIVYIARKLCVNEHMIDEIERTHNQQIARLAHIRAKDIFEAIVSDQQIFEKRKKPKNIKEAAHNILENVFGIICK